MLIAFESQDGAGKTTLLNAAHAQLAADGVDCLVVQEFSTSRHGQRLRNAVARDKFLRPVADDENTPITRALEIAADFYYLDHHMTGPALSRGTTVLKDRHRDTNIYTVAPTLVTTGAMPNEATALTWLTSLNAHLDHTADLTIYVDAPLTVRIERIRHRQRSLLEHRSYTVTDEDIQVFEHRDGIAKTLIAANPSRYLVIDNTDIEPAAAAAAIISAARQRSGKPFNNRDLRTPSTSAPPTTAQPPSNRKTLPDTEPLTPHTVTASTSQLTATRDDSSTAEP